MDRDPAAWEIAIADRAKLPDVANAAIDDVLLEDETLVVTIKGAGDNGFAASEDRLFWWRNGRLVILDLREIDSVAWGRRELLFAWLRGPEFGDDMPTFRSLDEHPYAMPLVGIDPDEQWMVDDLIAHADETDDDDPGQGRSAIGSYRVIYLGGLPDYPQRRLSALRLEIWTKRFTLAPDGEAAAQWFSGLVIPVSAIRRVEIVDRVVSTFEGIVGGLNSRQLNQANNIHLTFDRGGGRELVLRLEMLSGVTVMGQAGRCRDLMDRLRTSGLLRRIESGMVSSSAIADGAPPALDIPDAIRKLAALRDDGLITGAEFEAKRIELLARL